MTPKQKNDFNRMREALILISKKYQTTSSLYKKSEAEYGLNYEEALEMAYENMQWEAAKAVKGVKEIK